MTALCPQAKRVLVCVLEGRAGGQGRGQKVPFQPGRGARGHSERTSLPWAERERSQSCEAPAPRQPVWLHPRAGGRPGVPVFLPMPSSSIHSRWGQSGHSGVRYAEPGLPAPFLVVLWGLLSSPPGLTEKGGAVRFPGGAPRAQGGGLCGCGVFSGCQRGAQWASSCPLSLCSYTRPVASLPVGRTELKSAAAPSGVSPVFEWVSVWWLVEEVLPCPWAENAMSINSREKHPVAKGGPGQQTLSFILLVCSSCAKGLVRTLRNKQKLSVL